MPINCPATRPIKTTQNNLKSKSRYKISAAVPIKTKAPAAKIPVRRDHNNLPMSAPSPVLTKKVPIIDAKIPIDAIRSGNVTKSISVTEEFPIVAAPTAARATVAIIDPTYDSNKSAPIPATSPTLSPTLSATVAGFLGSSSGIPCSTLPTKSAPTSAALV